MPLQFRLPQGLAAQGLMRPTLVIKAEPLADADARLETVAAGLQVNLLIRQAAPQPFDETLSAQRPRPFMRIRTLAVPNLSVKAVLVNCIPLRC